MHSLVLKRMKDGALKMGVKETHKLKFNVKWTCINKRRLVMQLEAKMLHGWTTCNKLSKDSLCQTWKGIATSFPRVN